MIALARNWAVLLFLLYVAVLALGLFGVGLPKAAVQGGAELRIKSAAQQAGVVLVLAIGTLVFCAAFGVASWLLSVLMVGLLP